MAKRRASLSILVTDQLKLGERIEAAAMERFEAVQAGLATWLAPALDGEEAPDSRALHRLLAKRLRLGRERLAEADLALSHEQRVAQLLRERRAELAALMLERMRLVQAQLIHHLGVDSSAQLIGYRKGLQRLPLEMVNRIALQAAEALRRPDAATLPIRHAARTLDFSTLAADLEGPAIELAELLVELAAANAKVQSALATKLTELEGFKSDLRGATAFLEGCYRLSGHTFAADRLVPKERRPRKPRVAAPDGGQQDVVPVLRKVS